MATLINIEGTLINLDNVTSIVWLKGASTELLISFNAISEIEHQEISFADTPATRAAYEWLKRTCVATFSVPEEKEVQS